MSFAENRKASHDYFVEDTIEAGVMLDGWEVKSIREGRANLKESYVMLRGGEVFLTGSHISALSNASTHTVHDPVRDRKLLLHREEISKLSAKVTLAGYTIVPIRLTEVQGRIKCEIGLAKGKKQHDKRNSERDRDVGREVQQELKSMRV